MGVLNQIDLESTGIIPLSLDHIFRTMGHRELIERAVEEWSVHISFMQIYQDQVSDLLNPENTNLSVREENGEVFVGDLCEVPV